MDPILLQKQIRNNCTDLQDFYKEICEWGEEMKQKDDLLKEAQTTRTKEKKEKDKKNEKTPKKQQTNEKVIEKKKPIRGFDYSAWDKFDVEAECAKLDEENKKEESDDDSGDLTDEFDENAREQAVLEKEKGNKFVKCEKWDEAIKHYTQAIEYYGYDPIFYANRALCHLKKQNLKAAESDCTVALQLDKTYVKAYQRRAAAREGLNQLQEAHEDLLKVFDYEPNNKESKAALAKLEKKMKQTGSNKTVMPETKPERPKSKFTISRNQQKQKLEADNSSKQQNTFETKSDKKAEKPNTTLESKESGNNIENNAFPQKRKNISELDTNMKYWQGKCDVEFVRPVFKPAHLRSKKALKRIKIKEVTIDAIKMDSSETANARCENKNTKLPIATGSNTLICDNLKVVERNPNNEILNNEERDNTKTINSSVQEYVFAVPHTSVQFMNDWKIIKHNSDQRYHYLKQIEPKRLPDIFKDSLESDLFSDILKTLAEEFVKYQNPIVPYLMALIQVKRFATLVMFMSAADKKYLSQLMEYLKSKDGVNNEEIDILTKKYEV